MLKALFSQRANVPEKDKGGISTQSGTVSATAFMFEKEIFEEHQIWSSISIPRSATIFRSRSLEGCRKKPSAHITMPGLLTMPSGDYSLGLPAILSGGEHCFL